MLVTSVILVLREVLEAAMLVSVLLALSRSSGHGLRWIWLALPLALAASLWLALSLDTLTDALEGAGQEVVNALLQVLVFLLITLIVFFARLDASRWWPTLCCLMILAVASAVTREGAEIWVYTSSFKSAEGTRTAVLAGSAIGAGIGLSLGVLLYSALRALPPRWHGRLSPLLLGLIAAGMVMQASMLLQQVDWLEAGQPLWDSSWLVREESLLGELLYAVFGYEATPSAAQVRLYGLSLLLVLAASALPVLWSDESNA
jgi:high-affinity iron transporter